MAPFLEDRLQRGIERYGTNFVSGPNTTRIFPDRLETFAGRLRMLSVR
jgi:hypothetical protein